MLTWIPKTGKHVWHAADQALIITQPQFPALADAVRILNDAQINNKVLVGAVLNKRGKHDLSLEEVEEYLGIPVVAEIPFDDRFDEALKKRQPYFFSNLKRPGAKAIQQLAARIVNKPL